MPQHDPRVPAWVIGHNPNTLAEVRAFLDAGANAIEPDIQIDAATGLVIVAHDAEPDSWTPLDLYLEGIREIAQRDNRLTMIVFDSKVSGAGAGKVLLDGVHKYLQGLGLTVAYSVSSRDMRSFFTSMVPALGPKEAVMVDEDADVNAVVKDLEAMGATRIAYGDGTNVMKAAPKVHREMDAAVFRRSITGRPQFIETWVLADISTIADYFRAGVDGIIVDRSTVRGAVAVLKKGDLARTRRLANRGDNPFASSTAWYGVGIQTIDRRSAGTDANVTVHLRGTKPGTIESTVDGYVKGRFESGHLDHVSVPAVVADIGDATLVGLSHDATGNAPGWLPDWVEVTSPGRPPEYASFGVWIDGSTGTVWRPLGRAEYTLAVHTSDQSSAGTDADIYFELTGTKGSLARRINGNAGSLFERGHHDTVKIVGNDIGNLLSLRLENDGSGLGPDWHVDEVRVTANTGVPSKLFNFNHWVNGGSSRIAT